MNASMSAGQFVASESCRPFAAAADIMYDN